MRAEREDEAPRLREDAGRLWRAQEPPVETLRCLRERLGDPGREEREHHRHAVFAMAAVLLILIGAGWLARREEAATAGLRLDLRSGRLHLVWFQASHAGDQP